MDEISHTAQAEWKSESKCISEMELFDHTYLSGASKKTEAGPWGIDQAKAVCNSCSVKDICLETAMEDEAYLLAKYRWGIRGGLTARERMQLLKHNTACAKCKTGVVAPSETSHRINPLCLRCTIIETVKNKEAISLMVGQKVI